MNQLGAMVRYELLMAWRRGSLPILGLLLTATLVGFGLLFEETRSYFDNFDFVENTIHLSELMLGELVVVGVSLPLLLGDTIPLDRQFRVRELLDALPISRALYLGGKLLSVWIGVILSVLLSGLIGGTLLYAIWEGFDPRAFAALWSSLIPLGLTIAAITVLANARSRSRRESVTIGLLILTPSIILAVMTMLTLGRAAALIDPAYAYQLNIQGFVQRPASAAEIASGIVTMLVIDTTIMFAVWTIVWGQQRTFSAD